MGTEPLPQLCIASPPVEHPYVIFFSFHVSVTLFALLDSFIIFYCSSFWSGGDVKKEIRL
jgi:hypothetical protein